MRLIDAARAASLLVILAAGCRARPIDGPHAPPPAPAPRPAARVAVEPISASVGTGVAVASVAGRRTAIVADEDEHAIEILDLDARSSVARFALDGAPGQILVAPGGRIFVALRDRAEIAAFELRDGLDLAEVARHETGDEPWGLALADGGATVLATTIASARLEAFAAKDLAPVFAVSLARDPRAVVVAEGGARAFVSHASGSTLSIVDLGGRSARELALDAKERRRDFGMSMVTKPMPMWMPSSDPFDSTKFTPAPPPRVRIEMKRSAEQGFALAMIGEHVLLPETLVMTSDNERIPTGYGSIEQSTLGANVPYVARVDSKRLELENAVFSGPEDRACFEKNVRCLLPRAAATDGAKAYVACLDTDEIEVVDPAEDAEKAPACKKTLAARPRIHVDKPSAVAFDPERRAVVAVSSMARTVTVAAVGDATPPVAIALAPPKSAPSASVAAGRRLFHTTGDARISSDGRACASCHVDGREDGLLWPTPKGTRQTPMLAGRIAETAPYGWNGEHPTLAVHVTSTVKNLGGKGLGDEDLQALAAYVGSMKAPPKRTHDGSGAIARGKAIFGSPETECSACHTPATRFTDGDTHALGASKTAFATPSLAFVGETAPYFHDARYRTLEELVERCDGVMGHTKHLSGEDRAALVAYLRSL